MFEDLMQKSTNSLGSALLIRVVILEAKIACGTCPHGLIMLDEGFRNGRHTTTGVHGHLQ